jgi:hypothetical protein
LDDFENRRDDWFDRYQTAYLERWGEIKGKESALIELTRKTFGPDALETGLFEGFLKQAPEVLLAAQWAAFLEFLDEFSGEELPPAPVDRSEARNIVSGFFNGESALPEALAEISLSMNQWLEEGMTAEQIIEQFRQEIADWIREQRGVIQKNREAILDELIAMEQSAREQDVVSVLKKFGLMVPGELDIDLKGFAAKMMEIIREARRAVLSSSSGAVIFARFRRESMDPRLRHSGMTTTPNEDDNKNVGEGWGEGENADTSPESIRSAEWMADAIAALGQNAVIEFEIPENLTEETSRLTQIDGLMNAARNLAAMNARLEIRVMASSASVAREADRMFKRGINGKDSNAARLLNQIKVIPKSRQVILRPTVGRTVIYVAAAPHSPAGNDEMKLDSLKYANGDEIVYSDSEQPDTLAKMLVLAAAAVAAEALSQKTVESLALSDSGVLRVKNPSYLKNLFLLVQIVAVRAFAASA